MMLGNSVLVSFLLASGSMLGVLAGASFLSHINRFNHSLTHLSDYFWLGIAAVICGSLYAFFYSGSLFLNGLLTKQTFLHYFLQVWKRDALGIILATPIILAFQQKPKDWFKQERIVETVACFGLAFLAGQIIFMEWFHDVLGMYSKAYFMFIFVTWSAVRFGRQGVFLVISFTGIQALLGAIHGIGFFAVDIAKTDLTNLWFYMLVLTDIGLALDFVLLELKRAEQLERFRNQVLELLAQDAPLRVVLQSIVCTVEKENLNRLCRILLIDNDGEHLIIGATTDLPNLNSFTVKSVRIVVDGIKVSDVVERSRVIESRQKEPHLTPVRKLAAELSICSEWLEPIVGASGKILGAIAIYPHKDAVCNADDTKLIAQVANLAGIAIDQSRINEELQQALLVYQNSSEAMAITSAKGIIITVNPAFTELTGYNLSEVKGENIKILSSGHHDKKFYKSMWNAINTTGHWQGEILNRRKNNEIYTEWLTINTIYNESASAHRRVALFSDITNKKQAEDLIWKQANFDTLTGLPNRSMFLNRLNQGIKNSIRTDRPLALIFLDLDHFKEVNDSLGHNAGDKLLKEASQRLTNCVRISDTVARLGGDEFVIIIDKLDDLGSVERVAQNILVKLEEPFNLDNQSAYVTASIGITLFPRDATNIDELLKNADQAMYLSKNTGRNRFSYFTPSMQALAQKRMCLINDLHIALSEGQFSVHYQPIVNLSTGITDKAEALIRWHHPKRGLVSPAEFITAAEETGLIHEIGEWVFQEAAQQVAIWRGSLNPDFQISINKSPVQFLKNNKTHVEWISHLGKLNLPGSCIVVEITEGMLLDSNITILDQLMEFRDAGIQVSLDDFGTGYSSLSYLQKFDIDYLKIDKSFVCNLEPDSSTMALCEAIIVMAHKLGLKVVAEGIETQAQRDLLIAAKCDYGQGYLFSKPVPAIEFEKYFNTFWIN